MFRRPEVFELEAAAWSPDQAALPTEGLHF